MAARSSPSVRYLVVVLALVAVCGFAQGVVHALNAPRTETAAAGDDPGRDPVPLAKPLAAGVVLDEARVRQIAREEADAAMTRARPKKAVVKDDDEATADTDASTPAVKPVTAKPADPAIPAPPPPAPPGPQ